MLMSPMCTSTLFAFNRSVGACKQRHKIVFKAHCYTDHRTLLSCCCLNFVVVAVGLTKVCILQSKLEAAKAKAEAMAKAKASGKGKGKQKTTRSDQYKKQKPLDRRMFSDKRAVNHKAKKRAAKKSKPKGRKNAGKSR